MVFDRAEEIVIKQASVGEVIRASVDVLDRAGIETASKSTVAGNMGVQIYLPDNGREDNADSD